jgi:hypothetical protein
MLQLPWAKVGSNMRAAAWLTSKQWFNQRKNKPWRIAFFLSMCLSALTPQVHMMYLYGMRETVLFYVPVLFVVLLVSLSKAGLTSDGRSSALSYVVGLVMYAGQFPFVLPLRFLPSVLTPVQGIDQAQPLLRLRGALAPVLAHCHPRGHLRPVAGHHFHAPGRDVRLLVRQPARDALGPHKALSALTERHAFSAPACRSELPASGSSRPPKPSREHVCCRCV